MIECRECGMTKDSLEFRRDWRWDKGRFHVSPEKDRDLCNECYNIRTLNRIKESVERRASLTS